MNRTTPATAKTERNQEIYNLRKLGLTIQNIADNFGISEKRVRAILQNMEDKIEKQR